jgi:hypothetical protein
MAARTSSPKGSAPRWRLLLAVTAWAIALGAGLYVMARYESTPGPAALAPRTWPEESTLTRRDDGATLVMFAHPRCPCTRASIAQLASVMSNEGPSARVYVLFTVPAGADSSWRETDTWRDASAIAGVTTIHDEEGAEAARFGARTSGEVLVFDASGSLVFEGGITGARGHAGDNLGSSTVATLLSGRTSVVGHTPVFGCELVVTAKCPLCAHEDRP